MTHASAMRLTFTNVIERCIARAMFTTGGVRRCGGAHNGSAAASLTSHHS
jgi:hypothetical protein